MKKPVSKITDSILTSLEKTEDVHLLSKNVGFVIAVLNGVAIVKGLDGLGFEELVLIDGKYQGFAFNLSTDEAKIILLDETSLIRAGMEVERLGRVIDVPVGEELLGRVIDAKGKPLDDKGELNFKSRLPIQREAPAIVDRQAVATPLQTGIKVIDALIPIGHGQRELILGDKQTGKTSIAIDMIINQKDTDVICVYCAIGQRASTVAKVIDELKERDALKNTIVVVAGGDQVPGLRYITPYAATSIAEYFMYKGKKTLVIYDDLTNHAGAYRELSLLLKRPPGREAYPGDIFYIHAHLLERATQLSSELGGGSMTAIPIITTEAQDIAAYIPTNLISITDGQIFLSTDLFEKGHLPAVDIGKSVSRVGGKAQIGIYRAITQSLKLEFAQFEELEVFTRLGAQLDEATQAILNHGRRIRWVLNQKRFDPIDVQAQVLILMAFVKGLADKIPLEKLPEAEMKLREAAATITPETDLLQLAAKVLG